MSPASEMPLHFIGPERFGFDQILPRWRVPEGHFHFHAEGHPVRRFALKLPVPFEHRALFAAPLLHPIEGEFHFRVLVGNSDILIVGIGQQIFLGGVPVRPRRHRVGRQRMAKPIVPKINVVHLFGLHFGRQLEPRPSFG
jgi:hypothetical protein